MMQTGFEPRDYFLEYILFFLAREMAASEDDVEVEVNDGCIKPTDWSSYKIWKYFTVSNSSETKTGGVKIAVCKFVIKPSVVVVLRPKFRGVLY